MKKFPPPLMESEVSLSDTQEPVIGSYPTPDESSQHFPIKLP